MSTRKQSSCAPCLDIAACNEKKGTASFKWNMFLINPSWLFIKNIRRHFFMAFGNEEGKLSVGLNAFLPLLLCRVQVPWHCAIAISLERYRYILSNSFYHFKISQPIETVIHEKLRSYVKPFLKNHFFPIQHQSGQCHIMHCNSLVYFLHVFTSVLW